MLFLLHFEVSVPPNTPAELKEQFRTILGVVQKPTPHFWPRGTLIRGQSGLVRAARSLFNTRGRTLRKLLGVHPT